MTPTIAATGMPRRAAQGPQVAYGNREFFGASAPPDSADPFNFTSMSPAVSQVSSSTRTRLRILRRLIMLMVFLLVVALALAQFTELKRLATGILASTAVLGLIVGFAAQHTIANMVAGVQLAVTQPIKIGDPVTFDEVEGRVTDITLSYTYVDPGDGSSVVIPNQLLVEGIIHNRAGGETPR
jgi:small-conductance mechanosensitive channel